ncbi:MAG: hypothetical protein M3N47_14045 [Chloroflexota bacterium]|nr:hypothetical protein [Chloroflexota bacterium]
MGSIAARATLAAVAAASLLAWPTAAPGATPVRKDFYGDGPNKTSFRVSNRDGRRVVRYFAIQLGSGCAAESGGITGSVRVIRISRSGRFQSTFRLGSLIYQRVTGRFTSSRRAAGTFRTRTNVERLCDTGVKRWTAKAVDRRPVRDGTWRGATSAAGSRLSFRVSSRGRVVSAIQGTVPSNCQPSSTFSQPVTRAIVAPDGSFRLPLTLEPGFFAGRFTGERSATGTLSAVLSAQNSIPKCFSGVVPWAATR